MSAGADPENFRIFILAMLKKANINEEYRQIFTDPEGMQLFTNAFTHPSFDPDANYETLELIGDGILKGVLCQYIVRRFPKGSFETTSTYHGIISKIVRNLESNKFLSPIALDLGFWPYIRIGDEEEYTTNRNKILEDVFEAFLGALAEVVDMHVKRGLGYNYVYNFMVPIIDPIYISTNREDLDDPVTIINELYTGRLRAAPFELCWGPANYDTMKIFVRKVPQLPQTANVGDLLYDEHSRQVHLFTQRGWINFNSAPLSARVNMPKEAPFGKVTVPADMTLQMYTKLWGFPRAHPTVNGQPVRQIMQQDKQHKHMRPMEQYGAIVIGQGIGTTAPKAKEMASRQGVEWMKRQGYERTQEKSNKGAACKAGGGADDADETPVFK